MGVYFYALSNESDAKVFALLAMNSSFMQTASFTRFEFGLKRGIYERAELG